MAAKRRPRSGDSKELGGNGGDEGSGDVDEESGKSGEDAAMPSPLKRAEERSPPSLEDARAQGSGKASPARGGVALKTTTTTSKRAKKPSPASQEEDEAEDSGDASPVPDDRADAVKSAATPKRGETPQPLQEEERPPEKRAAAGPDAASAPKRKKKKSKRSAAEKDRRKKKKKDRRNKRKTNKPSPQLLLNDNREEHRGREREMAEQEHVSDTLAVLEQEHASDKDVHSVHGEEHADDILVQEQQQRTEVATQDNTLDSIANSFAAPSPRLNLRSNPERMAFWGVEVRPGEPYTHEPSCRGRLSITQATLGNLESVGWSTIQCSAGAMKQPVNLCALNSASGMCRLDLEYDEEQNVVFSVVGNSSVHLAGYYKIHDAAASVQALLTQIQEADDHENTHVHGTTQEHNAPDTEVHDAGSNQMVGQAGLNSAANVQVLVAQSQEAAEHEATHADQMVGQSGLNIMIDELKIEELKSGDHNADIASDGKKVKVKYIGRLKNGTVIDPIKGGPVIYTFTLGAGRVIAGWHQGIKGMRVGGKRKLTIPPALAYKDKPQKETIPANSWLVYEIELLEVSEPGKKPKKKSRSVNHHKTRAANDEFWLPFR